MLVELGQPDPLGHPVEELLAVGAEIRAWHTLLRHQLVDLLEADLGDEIGAERTSVLVGLYERALDRTQRLLIDMCKLGVDERLVRIKTNEAAAFVDLVESVLSAPALDLTQRQRADARRLIVSQARELAMGGNE